MRKRQTRRDGREAYDLADVNEQELAKDPYGGENNSRSETRSEARAEREGTAQRKQDTKIPPFGERKEPKSAQTSGGELEGAAKLSALPPAPEQTVSDGKDARKSEQKAKKRSRRASGAPYVALIILCFIGASALIGYSYFERRDTEVMLPADSSSPDVGEQQSPSPSPLPEQGDASTVYDLCSQSAVTVAATKDGVTRYLSGTVVFEGGFVATLCESVADADKIVVISADGTQFPAELVGAQERVNLALLSTQAHLPAVIVGSDALFAGSEVFAIGSLDSGSFCSSLICTRVARADRQARISDGDGKEWIWSVLQLGRLSDPSLGGCPIFNSSGQAIGIATSCPPEGEVSLAIPMERALDVLRAIREGGEVPASVLDAIVHAPPTLGILGEQRSTESVVGVCVVGFTNESSDAARKLRVGDVIYKIGDVPTPDTVTLRAAVEARRPSEAVEIFVWRGTQRLSFWVNLQ